jgi:hypothetical protein
MTRWHRGSNEAHLATVLAVVVLVAVAVGVLCVVLGSWRPTATGGKPLAQPAPVRRLTGG